LVASIGGEEVRDCGGASVAAIRREHDCRSIAGAFAPRKIVMYNACHSIANVIAAGAVWPVYSVMS